MPKQTQKNHIPVLSSEVLELLAPKPGEHYLDLTAGYGGHASEILKTTKSNATLVDRDINAVNELKKLFKGLENITFMHQDFYHASQTLVDDHETFDLILADLGVSSPHLDKGERGFSISKPGPLDMRMDESQNLTASDIVNDYSAQELTRILRDYGQEPKAKRIAQSIIDSRPVNTTEELATIAAKAWPGHSRVHPATRTFQAIRIAVNDELGQLEQSLPLWLKLLKPGGRIGVISFHSLEDALVKRFFAEHGAQTYDAELVLLTKRPVQGSPNEIVYNPRARSAKLRVALAKN